MTTSLREEIAEKFNDCMGYWEGIKVPDWDDGHSSIDYADEILKLIEKRIDSIKNENTPKIAAYTLMSDSDKCLFTGYHKALNDVKELLK